MNAKATILKMINISFIVLSPLGEYNVSFGL